MTCARVMVRQEERMKVLVSLFAVLFAACGSVNEEKADAGSDGASMADAAVDAEIDAPPIACTQTTCTNDTLEVCGSDNMIERSEHCNLGCFDQTRCNRIDPSNGLASSVDQAEGQTDVTLPDGITINTDSGTVNGPSGTIAVATSTVTQISGLSIRVLVAKSFTVGSVRVRGSLPLALVASSTITIRGILDVSADGGTPGPGASICAVGTGGASNQGIYSRTPANNSGGYPMYIWTINGSGGGGFGTAGGGGGTVASAYTDGAAGPANGTNTLVPLRGGCAGYATIDSSRGAGGGAIQLVANEEVHLVNAAGNLGIIDAGGGGGAHGMPLGHVDTSDSTPIYPPGGGGSGGGVLIETGKLILDGGTAITAGGGGGGGYGACTPSPHGADATPSGTASGGACGANTRPASSGGAGATTGAGDVGGDCNETNTGEAGSGGGGLGRIRINTRDGSAMTGVGTILRADRTSGIADVR